MSFIEVSTINVYLVLPQDVMIIFVIVFSEFSHRSAIYMWWPLTLCLINVVIVYTTGQVYHLSFYPHRDKNIYKGPLFDFLNPIFNFYLVKIYCIQLFLNLNVYLAFDLQAFNKLSLLFKIKKTGKFNVRWETRLSSDSELQTGTIPASPRRVVSLEMSEGLQNLFESLSEVWIKPSV
jgi:hypothetical protein